MYGGGGGEGGEKGRGRMNRAETAGGGYSVAVCNRCFDGNGINVSLLSSKKKEGFSRVPRDEQPVIKFAIVHWLPRLLSRYLIMVVDRYLAASQP